MIVDLVFKNKVLDLGQFQKLMSLFIKFLFSYCEYANCFAYVTLLHFYV